MWRLIFRVGEVEKEGEVRVHYRSTQQRHCVCTLDPDRELVAKNRVLIAEDSSPTLLLEELQVRLCLKITVLN